MADTIFSDQDIRQIENQGTSPEKVLEQIELFKRGFPFANLERPCTKRDGIHTLSEDDIRGLEILHKESAASGRFMKFVPASGAASRMFKLLLSFNTRYNQIKVEGIRDEARKGDSDCRNLIQFIEGIKRFAFFDDLKVALAKDGLDIEAQMTKGEFKEIVDHVLNPKGLNLANLPKGLIKFHAYPDHFRTPIEEHLVEASAYVLDQKKMGRLHFTVSPEHESAIADHIADIRSLYEESGLRYEISFSTQKPSTDTIAVDMQNRPFRNKDGTLLFRPGGHGALLENLKDQAGDILYIKNIDNVVPDRLKSSTYTYKRALGGYLVQLQDQIFGYLRKLYSGGYRNALLNEALEFSKTHLNIVPPSDMGGFSKDEKADFLLSRLNRPIRVCGMVENEGEPGGGPFWVGHEDKTLSLQIVESSQVDMDSSDQKTLWESSTHFNPVDLVCGVRDYRGRPFDLSQFIDPNTGFISAKSKEGRELKALELPGLWNGAMAHWISIFVEVPIITFNPVKTILDLLRPEHQPAP